MPRMFDMLRGKGRDDEEKKKDPNHNNSLSDKKKEPEENQNLTFPKNIIKNDITEKEKGINHSLVSKKLISDAKKHGIDNQEIAKRIYKDTVDTVKTLLTKIRSNEDLSQDIKKLYIVLDDIVNQLLLGDSLLGYIYEEGEDEHLPYHITNVLILSISLGISMGFNKSKLKYLGLSCVFCDVGMDAIKDVVSQRRKLTDSEYSLLKIHISKSLETVERIDSIDSVIKEAIMMHHERANGSGYPQGAKADEINTYAKIIGLVDTYEAMTHNRPHRDKMDAHKTMKFLVDVLKDHFDHEIMKMLINKMSIYPIGSIVKLDTEETARVVGVRPGSPLRPVVMIIKDAFGQPVKESIIIDLSKREPPSIKSSV